MLLYSKHSGPFCALIERLLCVKPKATSMPSLLAGQFHDFGTTAKIE